LRANVNSELICAHNRSYSVKVGVPVRGALMFPLYLLISFTQHLQCDAIVLCWFIFITASGNIWRSGTRH